MILYLDTSALLKMYLTESGSQQVQNASDKASMVCTHIITYAEIRTAFARAVRMKRLSESECLTQVNAFERDWQEMQVIAVDEFLVRKAATHAERFDLRGYDSVHIAAAERAFGTAGRPSAFMLAAFDNALCAAAQALGIPMLI